ncbi:M23 family metallopeptidase [Virgibacillus sp. 179-BFC.A HS]|uniref:M23 family metallopeptidase n=1 Tax=Tigheibacillus jepli TaxID=3035914 RepID=A0ABU5CE35_9BACI|nr:M23 family metallopeptidase [Virgibacillus sp. 179-BFC.A HS]MDY0404578.1 M23 family metallopeptidase [Virgibacillus sp. 179-BFC.A HS]
MKEENTPKNKWSRIYRKKWFFPAVYLVVAALLVSGVVWYQNLDKSPEATKEPGDAATKGLHDQDAKPVLDQEENIQMPVAKDANAEIVTKFFDYDADEESQAAALVLYNSRYYQSKGIDLAAKDKKSFDVVASLSGTVQEVKEDPLLGNVVVMEHGNDVKTYYASLQDVAVKTGDNVKQGDKLGTAGSSLFGKENGTHVHFELSKSEQKVNPESYFNQPVSKLLANEAEGVSEQGDTDDKAAKDDQQGNADDQGKTEENSPDSSDDQANDQSDDQVDENSSDTEDGNAKDKDKETSKSDKEASKHAE